MSENFDHHTPVLLKEATENLIQSRDGTYIDATYGRGSHSDAILNLLSAHGRLIAFDKDLEAVNYAQSRHGKDPRFAIYHHSFNELQTIINQLHLSSKIDGILFDLGVSSPQLDNPARGFSFMQEGLLDMRMDTSKGESAADWLANVNEKELADVLYQYGEEKHSRRIAKAIVTKREQITIQTTKQLVDIISSVSPRTKYQDKHPATRSFQAIRIFINQELSQLQQGLEQAFTVLAPKGRLAVISFHSLEDRIVKQFIHSHEKGEPIPRKLPIKGASFQSTLKSLSKPIKPSLQEINVNPRARSAVLRLAEKLS